MNSKLFAGFSREEITPVPGEFGSYRLSPTKRALGVHDPLFTHALWLENETIALLLISIDIGMLEAAQFDEIKAEIARECGLPASRILIAATHTHNAAEVYGEEPEIDVSAQLRRVREQTVLAAQQAQAQKFSAKIGWGHFEVPIAQNRFRARLGGAVDFADQRLDFLRIDDAQGNYQGILWHYAAHPTTAMKAEFTLSADYYGLANAALVEALGGFSLFFNGACGNINPELGERTYERAVFYGNQIAEKLIQHVPRLKTTDSARLGILTDSVEIPLTSKIDQIQPAVSREEVFAYFSKIAELKITPAEYPEYFQHYQRARTSWWRYKLLDVLKTRQNEHIPLQALQIQNALVLTIPGEIFIEFQFQLQQSFPDVRAMIFGYTNGYCGYIPDPASFEIDGYETNPSWMHRAGKFAGTKMLEAGQTMLRKF